MFIYIYIFICFDTHIYINKDHIRFFEKRLNLETLWHICMKRCIYIYSWNKDDANGEMYSLSLSYIYIYYKYLQQWNWKQTKKQEIYSEEYKIIIMIIKIDQHILTTLHNIYIYIYISMNTYIYINIY